MSKQTLAGKEKLVLVIASFLCFINGIQTSGFQFSLLYIGEEFQLTTTMMGVLVAVQFAAMAIMPLLFGRMADRIGKKFILIIFIPLLGAGCLCLALASSLPVLLLGAGIFGAGYAVSACASAAALSDLNPVKSAQYMNLIASMMGLGAVLTPIITSYLMEQFDATWRVAMWMAAIGLLLIYPLLFFAQYRPPQKHPQAASILKGITQVLKRPIMLLFVAGIFLYMGIETGLLYFIDSAFALEFNNGAFGVYAISLFWLATMVSCFVFGLLHIDPRKEIIFSMCGAGGLVIALAFSRGAELALVLTVLIGLACGPVWPMLMGMATRESANSTGIASSVMMAGGSLGGAAFSAIVGAGADLFGLRTSFLLLAAVACSCALVVYRAKKRTLSEKSEKLEVGEI